MPVGGGEGAWHDDMALSTMCRPRSAYVLPTFCRSAEPCHDDMALSKWKRGLKFIKLKAQWMNEIASDIVAWETHEK